MLVDVAVLGDRNVILICKDLAMEIHRMWSLETYVVPVITGATGTVSVILKIPEQDTVKARN